MKAVQLRAAQLKRTGQDHFALLQQVAADVASTAGGALQLSKYSLGYDGSNISSTEISGMLAKMNVLNPWSEMSSIAARCGFGSLALKESYDQALLKRNRAAHSPQADVQPLDLVSFCDLGMAIAASFDILASRAARLLRVGNDDILKGKISIASQIKLRFIDITGARYSEIREGGTRAVKIHSEHAEAWKIAFNRALAGHEAIVERNGKLLPIAWLPTDV
ncbi:hypothetical protein ACIGNX_23960 [Actinosynnema sp. NPDC053489]|uniref:hypothetical protein n=1 Tax=Actinosynnema sp. NPDC053489 TaxID=3363916 RepID=UPI0037CC9ABD